MNANTPRAMHSRWPRPVRGSPVARLDGQLQHIPLTPSDAGLLVCELAAQAEALQLDAQAAGASASAEHLASAVKYLTLALTSLRLATLTREAAIHPPNT